MILKLEKKIRLIFFVQKYTDEELTALDIHVIMKTCKMSI